MGNFFYNVMNNNNIARLFIGRNQIHALISNSILKIVNSYEIVSIPNINYNILYYEHFIYFSIHQCKLKVDSL
jgi:hypothetical protein